MYETSFYCSVVFGSAVQAAASLAHLPGLHLALRSTAKDSPPFSEQYGQKTLALAVVSLLYHLNETFPSQATYYRHLATLKDLGLNQEDDALKWISSLRAAMLSNNFARCENLTSRATLQVVLDGLLQEDSRLWQERALLVLVDSIRDKKRAKNWQILRSSYREFTLGPNTDTAVWLSRSMMLGCTAEDWMRQEAEKGTVVSKDGAPGRWTLLRVASTR